MNAFITVSMLLSMALVGNAQFPGNPGVGAGVGVGAGAGAGAGAGLSQGLGGSSPDLMLPFLMRSGLDMRSLMMMMSLSKNGQGNSGGASGMTLPLMMALRGGSDNILPLMMMMGKGKSGNIDPMMMMVMAGGNDNLMQMLPFIMAKNNAEPAAAGFQATAPAGAAQPKSAGLI